MGTSNKQAFTASVTDEHIHHITQIADKLKTMGCQIDGVLSITGIITGKVDKTVDLASLKIDGIDAIEKQRKVKKK